MTVTTPYSTALGAAAPDLGTFRELARDRRVIPVVRKLLADGVDVVFFDIERHNWSTGGQLWADKAPTPAVTSQAGSQP